MIKKLKHPFIHKIKNINLNFPIKYKLSNNIELFCFFTGQYTITRIDFTFSHNHFLDKNFINYLTFNDLILSGTNKYNSFTLHELLNYYGTTYDVYSCVEYINITIYVMNKFIGNILPVIKSILLESIFSHNEIETYKTNTIQNLIYNSKNNEVLANNAFKKIIFGKNTLYGYVPDINDIINIHPQNIRFIYKRTFNTQNCKIILSSHKNNYNILYMLKNCFDFVWPNNTYYNFSKKFQKIQPEPTGSYKIHTIKKTQSIIYIGKVLDITKNDSDYIILKFINTILGGYYNSRLMNILREEKGYTYNVSSHLYPYSQRSIFIIYTCINNNYLKTTLDIIDTEIKKICEYKVNLQELNMVKQYMLGEFINSFDNIFSISDKFKNFLNIKSYINYYQNYIDNVQSVNSIQIQYIAKKYLNNDFHKVII